MLPCPVILANIQLHISCCMDHIKGSSINFNIALMQQSCPKHQNVHIFKLFKKLHSDAQVFWAWEIFLNCSHLKIDIIQFFILQVIQVIIFFKFQGGISATFEDIAQCEANLKKLFFTAHRGRTLLVYLVILRYFNIAFPLGYYI